MKPVAFFDTECYPNYWLLKIRPDGLSTFRFRVPFSHADHVNIRTLFACYTVVSFNGNGYDVPMIACALAGYTVEQLKRVNDQIIVEGRKHWQMGLPEWVPSDHIDVMEVAPGAGGQKQYAGRIHCKTMRDLPYSPDTPLTDAQIEEVDEYCENDLDVLAALFHALKPQLDQRVRLSERYGIDLRSKSDAQIAEAVLRKRCEIALGWRIYKPDIDWNMRFKYRMPSFIDYQHPELLRAKSLAAGAVFQLGASGRVEMPQELEGLAVTIGRSTYKLGIGGLHSQEERVAYVSDEHNVLLDNDVASYYPSLILNSGEYPPAMGEAFRQEYAAIKDERLAAKALQKTLPKGSPEWRKAEADNEGGKIMINGSFGKTGSPYSVLFAPTMLIQTTLTGQLSLLLLIEWHEANGIPVVSANTDGIVIYCPRDKVATSTALIEEWQRRTSLEMETVEYRAIYCRDVNNYFAIKTDGDVKRKGEYSRAGLLAKKNPASEISSDAVAEFLANGTPIAYTIAACRDLRKFVTIQKVNGGGVKLWGDGPRKGTLVRDMAVTLLAHGWVKAGRGWERDGVSLSATDAYARCFPPQRPEYLGKVVRWYYSTQAPGPIVYETNGNTVGGSWGARPCMTLPDEFPDDIDYKYYISYSESILADINYLQ